MALGKRSRAGRNDLGRSIGATPMKRMRSTRAQKPATPDAVFNPVLPLAREFEAKTRAARPPGGPNFSVRGRHPGTQRMGTGTGAERPKGPIRMRLTANGGLMQDIDLPATSIRNTFGFWTNTPVHYQLVLRRHDENFNRMLSKSMPVFRHLGHTEDVAGEDIDVLANLATVNYCLRTAFDPANPNPLPKDVLREWGYFGVLSEIVRELDDSVTGFEESMEGVPYIRGPVLSFNLWGENLVPGTPLWFVLKMVDNIPATFMLDPENQRATRVYSKHGVLPRKSLQFVPYADCHRARPPDSFCRYYDNDDELQTGVRIYAGRAQYPPTKPNVPASRESVYNAHKMVTASGQVWVLMDSCPVA